MEKVKDIKVLKEEEKYIEWCLVSGAKVGLNVRESIKDIILGIARDREDLFIDLGYAIYKGRGEEEEKIKKSIESLVTFFICGEQKELEIEDKEGKRYSVGEYIELLLKTEEELLKEIGSIIVIGKCKGEYEEYEECKKCQYI